MISERSDKDVIYPGLIFHLSALSPQNHNQNCSDFCLPLDRVELPQSVDLQNQAMYEGERVTSSSDGGVSSSETVKAQLAGSEYSSLATSQLLSRQSSLVEEWFGNINNTHPNDISVDSSLEALFASTEWQDFKVETDDAVVTESGLADPSAYQSVNYQSRTNIPAAETVVCESLPLFSEVSETELQPVAAPVNVGEFSSQCIGGTFCTYTLPLC